jgi:HlyD family secretion protein
MLRILKIVFWLFLTIALVAIAYSYFNEEQYTPPTYSVGKIIRGDLVATVSATGTLNPVITVQVGSQASGIIQQLNVDFNQPVKKGELIAQIEPSLFKTQVAQAQANLLSATAARDKANVAMRDAKRQLERFADLHQQKVVSESELDTARFNYDAAVVEERVKQASIAQAQASLAQAEVNLAHTMIYAPIDGVVISRDVDVGQTVAASLQAPTLFTIAQDLSRMQIETEVDEAFIGEIHEGQAVSFSVFAYPKREFRGHVVQIRLKPKVEAGVVKYNCVIHVDNPDLALKPGMTATVSIEVDRHQDILKVDNAALRFVPEWPAQEIRQLRKTLKPGDTILWLQDDQELKPLQVETGLTGEGETEVRAELLQEGLSVALPPEKGNSPPARRRGLRLF